MSRASLYVFASLISGVSAALILSSNPSYTRPRGTAHSVKREQSAYNDCRTSSCQIAYLNSLEDFCLWAPSQPELDLSATGNTEHTLTAWCMKSTHGTRLIPDGTISRAHFVKTPEFIQITGTGNLTTINVPADGMASANGEDNHVPGLVFTNAYGQPEQIYQWTSFVSQERFCLRACNPEAASTACPRIYDISGCSENVAGNHDLGALEECVEDTEETPSALYREVSSTDSAYPPSCTTRRTIGNQRVVRARRAILSNSGSGTALASPTATAETVTTITFPASPTSTSNATTLMNSTTSTSSAPTTTTPFNHTAGHIHRHSRSHHHFTTFPASSSASPSSSSSSSSDPPPVSAALSPTSLTSTTSTYSSPDPALVTSTSSVTSTPRDPASSLPPISNSSVSHATSSSFSQPSPSPSSYTASSTPSTTPISTATPSTTTHSTSSSTSPVTSSSTSSHSSVTLTLAGPATPSSEITSSTTSSSSFRNTATQLGSQCPPVQQDMVDAGSITPPPSLLTSLILTIILSILVGVLSI